MDEREIGWLIEGDNCYWDGSSVDATGFTHFANDALRFARFQDAEKVKHWLLQKMAFALRTTEHIWIGGHHE